MISIDSALKILKKYGYSSLNTSPFIYTKNKEVGVNYSYIDNKYGITDRVISFHNDIDLDLFLKRYQWYKLNGKKEGVTLKLNNYEVSSPEVLYIRNNHVMSDNEMFHMKDFDKIEAKNQKLSHSKRLLVEAQNLLEHYYIEKNNKEEYSKNLYKKENDLKKYYVELQYLIDRYNKVNNHLISEIDDYSFKTDVELESDINTRINTYNKNLPKEEEIYRLIEDIWFLNKKLEINPLYMYALKNNDSIDEEIRIVVTKIDFMNELLSKKKCKLISLKKKFLNIDNQSTYESIYDENFEDKYKKFIDNKYNVLDSINEFRLTDYLNNFKTYNEYDIEKNINRCKNEKDNIIENKVSIDDINKSLKRQFNNNLDDKERNAILLYSSYYRELFDVIINTNGYESLQASDLLNILNITDNFNSIFEECYIKTKELLKLDCNEIIKNTVFKHINFDSKEKFIESIKNNIKILININDKIKLNNNVDLYFAVNDFENLGKETFIHTSTIIAPYMLNKKGNYRVITAKVKKGTYVLYCPYYLALPINNAYNQEISIMDKVNSEIIIDTRDIFINKDKNTVVYSRFKPHTINSKGITIVDKFDLDYKININTVTIEKRLDNE